MKTLKQIYNWIFHITINKKFERYDREFFEIKCMLRMLLKKNGYNGDLHKKLNEEMVEYLEEKEKE